jgi:hypothetical protein
MDLLARDAGDYLVVFGCSIFRHILGEKALDAIASVRAAVEKWRHVVLALTEKTLQPVRHSQKRLLTAPLGP